MFCSKCGKELDAWMLFCPYCGTKTPETAETLSAEAGIAAAPEEYKEREEAGAPFAEQAEAGAPAEAEVSADTPAAAAGAAEPGGAAIAYPETGGPEAEPDPFVGEPPKKTKNRLPAIIAAILIFAAVVALGINIYKTNEAKKLAGDYANAIFLFEQGEYEAAKEAFETLGDYGQSAAYRLDCEDGITYNNAMSLYKEGKYADALTAFTHCSFFRDSSEMIKLCEDMINYSKAVNAMDLKEYDLAAGYLKSINYPSSFRDFESLYATAVYEPKYQAASGFMEEGKFFSAFQLFSTIEMYKDSAEKMDECTPEPPAVKAVYKNASYKSTAVKLTIKAPESTSKDLFIKIYAKDGTTLAAQSYLTKGKSVTFNLKAGSYAIWVANGTQWFGEEEMFGTESYGNYNQVNSGKENKMYTFESGYQYSISLTMSAEE